MAWLHLTCGCWMVPKTCLWRNTTRHQLLIWYFLRTESNLCFSGDKHNSWSCPIAFKLDRNGLNTCDSQSFLGSFTGVEVLPLYLG